MNSRFKNRGIAVGIYTTNNAEACYHVLSNSRTNIAVVQDDNQLEKIKSVWHRLPHLKAIVQWEGEPKTPLNNVYTWNQLMKIGNSESNLELMETLKTLAINECCTLVYTSGTVGPPKGTMLSHDNLIWGAHSVTERVGFIPGDEVIVSYLPLSHVAAQVRSPEFHSARIIIIKHFISDDGYNFANQ
jgi:long-chain-fatty-acid--CoA ligase ACSBG